MRKPLGCALCLGERWASRYFDQKFWSQVDHVVATLIVDNLAGRVPLFRTAAGHVPLRC